MSLLASFVRRLLARLPSLFRGGREDAEAQEELRFHLEMETEKNLRAGMTPGEARRQARVRLGGVEAIRETVRDVRGGRLLEDLLRDLGYALRGAHRNPGFTLAAVVSLAIPIGFNTAAFTIIDSLLFGPLPVSRPAELVDVYTSDPGVERYSTTSYPDYLDLRAESDVFTDMAAHSSMVAAVRVDEDVDLVMGETVTGSYFQLLGVRPMLGRLLAPEDDRPGAARVAVISARLWERAFGRDPGVLGRSLRIQSQPYLVVGVVPPRVCRHGARIRCGPVDSDDVGRRRDDGGHQVVRGLPGRDPARTPGRPLAVRQGEAPRGCHPGSGGHGPRRDHGQSGRRLARLQRRSAGVSDADGRRAFAPAVVSPDGHPVRRPDAGGRGPSAGGMRERHGHAAGSRGGAAAGDRGAARGRGRAGPSRPAVVDREPRAVVTRRRGGAGPGLEPVARALRGAASPGHDSVHLRLRARCARVHVHGGIGGRRGRAGGSRAGPQRHAAESRARSERRRRGRARRRSPLGPARCARGGAVGGHGAVAGARGSPGPGGGVRSASRPGSMRTALRPSASAWT